MKRILMGLALSTMAAASVSASDLTLTHIDNLNVTAVSDNGVVVGSTKTPSRNALTAAMWTETNDVETISGTIPGSVVNDISSDGLSFTYTSTVAYFNAPETVGAFAVDPSGTSTIVVDQEGSIFRHNITSVSDNGKAVGHAFNADFAIVPFTWTKETGLTEESVVENFRYLSVSANGEKILGQEGTVFHLGDVYVVEGDSAQFIPGMVRARKISADGNTVVGTGSDAFEGQVWTQDEGTTVVENFSPTGIKIK